MAQGSKFWLMFHGSQGILKATDDGATWDSLVPTFLDMAVRTPPGQFKQYKRRAKSRGP